VLLLILFAAWPTRSPPSIATSSSAPRIASRGCAATSKNASGHISAASRENDMKPVMIGGIENHVHLLLGIPPTLAVSKAVQLIKGGSSAWIKETFPGLRGFGWQDGYGAFSVNKSQVPDVTEYIRGQREHHHVKSFEEEYRAFLDKHEIQYDERYVFDAEISG
jgi:putative transposase